MSAAILSFAVALMWAVSVVCQKIYLKRVNAHKAILISAIAMMVCALVMTLVYPSEVFSQPISVNDTILIVFASTIGLFFANITLFYALKHYDANKVVSLSYATPMIVLVLAYVVLNEPISISAIVGTAFIILGAYLIVMK